MTGIANLGIEPMDRVEGSTGVNTKQTFPAPDTSSGTKDSAVSDQTSPGAESAISRIRLRNSLKPFIHPHGSDKTGPDVIVDFEGPDDPYRPTNWSPRKKLATVIIYGLTAMGASVNSAIFSSASVPVAASYHVSTVVIALATTMILLGFAFGTLLWGPLSEVYGRKWVVLAPYLVSACFAFGCGAAANIETILITRFFQGIFSGSVITNTGGVLGDIYPPKERGTALVIYSLSVVCGPVLSPIVGTAIVTSHLRWRWMMYIVGIFQISVSVLVALFVDESYAPVLLLRKAQKLRYETGNWALHAKHEEWDVSLRELGRKYLIRPFQLLLDPTCFLMSFYASFVYGLIYGSLSAIPIVFGERRGWDPVTSSLPFIALLLGCVSGLVVNILNQKLYIRAMVGNSGKPVPEARLYPMMFGSFSLAGGLFLFAWTGDLDVTWVLPCVGIFLIGAGFYPIFQASLNYIVDTYLPVAASAVAAVTFMRSFSAAVFPLFVEPMFHTLGIEWGISLLGFVGAVMIPVPFLFLAFGNRIRAREGQRIWHAR